MLLCSSSHLLWASPSSDTGGIWEGLWENVTAAELLYISSPPHASLHLTSPLAHTSQRSLIRLHSIHAAHGSAMETSHRFTVKLTKCVAINRHMVTSFGITTTLCINLSAVDPH